MPVIITLSGFLDDDPKERPGEGVSFSSDQVGRRLVLQQKVEYAVQHTVVHVVLPHVLCSPAVETTSLRCLIRRWISRQGQVRPVIA